MVTNTSKEVNIAKYILNTDPWLGQIKTLGDGEPYDIKVESIIGGNIVIRKKFIKMFPDTADFVLIEKYFNVQKADIYLLALVAKGAMLELAKELEANKNKD